MIHDRKKICKSTIHCLLLAIAATGLGGCLHGKSKIPQMNVAAMPGGGGGNAGGAGGDGNENTGGGNQNTGGGGTGGGGGGGPTTTTTITPPSLTKPNSFYVTVQGDNVSAPSPDSTTVSITKGPWQESTIAAAQAAEVDDVINTANANPGSKIFRQDASAELSASGIGQKSTAGPLWAVTDGCVPGTNGCDILTYSHFNIDTDTATQGGVAVNEQNFDPNKPVDTVERQVSDFTSITGLENAKYGLYHEEIRSAFYTIDQNGDPQVDLTKGPATQSATYGSWFGGGTPTPAADMTALQNNNVQATYYGHFGGHEVVSNNGTVTTSQIHGSSMLNASFGNGTVTGSASDLNRYGGNGGPAAAGYDIGFNGTISGNTYSGTANYTPVGGGSTSGTGTHEGGFFGAGDPNIGPPEVAGAVAVKGAAPGVTGTTTVTGSYGGRNIAAPVP